MAVDDLHAESGCGWVLSLMNISVLLAGLNFGPILRVPPLLLDPSAAAVVSADVGSVGVLQLALYCLLVEY
ncbi:hypothetical protein Nepgr_018719 [Nepenthes gracilis]|uniref:Uncharacterized protein n=1 Tax=Nepenthes gracilis TaxID=150966 RepID=A0AAD3SRV6_NEPGR|nr:hypothetical protein Nepgr_018719 [Nepenthes gracilis]